MAAHSKLLAFLRDCHEGDARECEEDFSGTPGGLVELSRLVELSGLVEAEPLSPPLESLIQLDRVSTGEVPSWSGPVPVSLSPAQQKALRAASSRRQLFPGRLERRSSQRERRRPAGILARRAQKFSRAAVLS